MPTYSGKVVREQGGSVLRIGSSGSIVLSSGASENLESGAGLFVQSGACTTFNLSGAGAQTVAFSDGTRIATQSVGRDAPTHSASPGSLYIRSDGSVSNWYYNISSGATGSVWRAAASG